MKKIYCYPFNGRVKYYLFLFSVILIFTFWICQESFSEDAYCARLSSILEAYREKEKENSGLKKEVIKAAEKTDPRFNSYPKVACL